MMSPRTAPALDLDLVIGDPSTRIIVCCGSGGVGKTTTAAALGLRAAEQGRHVVVLTIDPARRLAQSMGLAALDNTPRQVKKVDEGAGGSLDAMMLDMKRTFDEVVLEHATPQRARAIMDNPFYQSLSSSFSGTQEYMAMEKLGQLRASGDYDLVVVDTPPTRSALDFLDAPQRLGSFLDGRFIRFLMAPAKTGGRTYLKVLGAGLGAVTAAMNACRSLRTCRRSSRPSTRCSGASGNGPTRRTACCRLQAPASWSSPRRSATPCVRRRTSWNGSGRRGCRWRGSC